eukprot:m.19177 g.19177  ORF g.19177 m.19177 type:complete len:74 (+) comp7990_c0_seq1:1963-2184(+)
MLQQVVDALQKKIAHADTTHRQLMFNDRCQPHICTTPYTSSHLHTQHTSLTVNIRLGQSYVTATIDFAIYGAL